MGIQSVRRNKATNGRDARATLEGKPLFKYSNELQGRISAYCKVGMSRCGVPARVAAGGTRATTGMTVAPLNVARTASQNKLVNALLVVLARLDF
jgi:hypothetical protein